MKSQNNNPYTVQKLTSENHEAYEEFVLSRADSLFYASLKFRQLLLSLLECSCEYLVCMHNGTVKGVMPIMSKFGRFGSVINSLPFYGSHGGILSDDPNAIDCMQGHYQTLISSKDILCSCLINPPINAHYSDQDTTYKDYRIGQITRLCEDDAEGEKLLASFHSKTRNMVRKSQKQNLSWEVDNTIIEFLYETHRDNLIQIGGIPKEKRFFELVSELLVPNRDYEILAARHDGELVAAILVFKYNKTIEYFTPVVVSEYRTMQPLSLLIFEGMKKYQAEGFDYWNWGGTWLSQEGVYRFKSRWNAKDHKYEYFIRVNDKRILSLTPSELMNEYSGFYTVPFSELESDTNV